MQTTQFDRQNLKQIRVLLEEALKSVADKVGIQVSIGRITFDERKFSTRLEAYVKAGEAKVTTAKNGLPEIGTKFLLRGRKFLVVGHAPNRPMYPIIVETERGKKYKVSTEQFEESIKGW